MRTAPIIVRFCSWFFLFMGVVAIFLLLATLSGHVTTNDLKVTFLAISASFTDNPALFVAINLYFIFAGVVSWAILWRRARAYDLAIVYCAVGLAFFGTMIALRIGLVGGRSNAVVTFALTLGLFLFHLTRNRTRWIGGGLSA